MDDLIPRKLTHPKGKYSDILRSCSLYGSVNCSGFDFKRYSIKRWQGKYLTDFI